jgi:hypothetical protein
MAGVPNLRLEELKVELRRLMLEQIESLRTQTYCGLGEEELRKQDERLERIRQVSSDFLALLKDEQT